MARAKPSCAGCQCFTAPAAPPSGIDLAAWTAQFKHLGRCQRFPQTVAKASDDHCFEYLAKEAPPDAR